MINIPETETKRKKKVHIPMNYEHTISVICSDEAFARTYSFLQKDMKEYHVMHFRSLKDFYSIEYKPPSFALFVDIETGKENCSRYFPLICESNQAIRIIITWDKTDTLFLEENKGIFHCIKKPLTHDKIMQAIEEAARAQFFREKRREPRFPVSLPVELYYKTNFWSTTTTNVSLHGMQVSFYNDHHREEIKNIAVGDTPSISACRLFLDKTHNLDTEHINISVDLRYIHHAPQNRTYMGFQFRHLDMDLRDKIHNLIP